MEIEQTCDFCIALMGVVRMRLRTKFPHISNIFSRRPNLTIRTRTNWS
jgi:hypothetical protein